MHDVAGDDREPCRQLRAESSLVDQEQAVGMAFAPGRELGRIVQFKFRQLSPEHREEVLGLRREIDQVVAGVLRDGVASGEFAVDDVATTALALLSMAIDVARWYTPEGRRTPTAIEAAYGDLAVRLVRAHHPA